MYIYLYLICMKKCSEKCKHCELDVIKRSQKFSPRCRSASWGRRTVKISSAGDSHYLYL